MADAGELTEFVNSGKVTLTNVTDSLTFKQLYNVQIKLITDVIKRHLTNNALEKFFEPRDFVIEADIMLTTPEIITWVNWTTQTNNLPDSHSWRVSFTPDTGTAVSISGTFRLSQLFFIAPEEGDCNYHIRLESIDGTPGS